MHRETEMAPLNSSKSPAVTVIELLAVITLFAMLVNILFLGVQQPSPAADGEVVIGYIYTSPNKMKTVNIPKPLKGGQSTFELVVGNRTFPLEAGKRFFFITEFPEGVDSFTIRGINPSEKLDPANPNAF